MSYRLEDLYHYAVTDEVTEEMARRATEQAVQQRYDEWLNTHPTDCTLKNVFTAGMVAGRNIRYTINKKIKDNGNTI